MIELSALALLSALVFSLPISAWAAQDAGSDPLPGMGVAETTDYSEASEKDMQPAVGETGWRYDTYYLMPLTRHMSESGLPLYGQIMLYPVGALIDLVQLPIGALSGLAGE
jgi:hypothetical protein